MASCSQLPLLGIALLCVSVPSSRADTLKITSAPSGASVEINGLSVGTTPYEEDVPGGYFHYWLLSASLSRGSRSHLKNVHRHC